MKKILLISVIILSMALTLVSQSLTKGKGKMSGTVTAEETREPIAGVTVKLFSVKGNGYFKPSPKTGKDGKWSVYYVREGDWRIDFVKEGYETKKISFYVDTNPGTKIPRIEITLKKLEGPAVSGEIVKQIEKGKILISEKKYDQALKLLQGVLEKHKDSSGIDIVNLYIGNIFSIRGEYEKAIEYYKKSVETFPGNKELILSIGNAYNNLKNHEKAMVWFGRLSIDDIGNIDTLYNIGVIAYNKGDFETAAKYFKKATEVDPKFADAFFQLGMAYIGLDKQNETVEALNKFMEMAPDSPNFETAKAIVDAYKEAK